MNTIFFFPECHIVLIPKPDNEENLELPICPICRSFDTMLASDAASKFQPRYQKQDTYKKGGKSSLLVSLWHRVIRH
jgi:hypothetical protein